LVLSLEVVQHCYDPIVDARTHYDMDDGTTIVAAPYHGCLKLALSVTGNWEAISGPLAGRATQFHYSTLNHR
jgi:hypothetical protein